jgi:hypothetical protein
MVTVRCLYIKCELKSKVCTHSVCVCVRVKGGVNFFLEQAKKAQKQV